MTEDDEQTDEPNQWDDRTLVTDPESGGDDGPPARAQDPARDDDVRPVAEERPAEDGEMEPPVHRRGESVREHEIRLAALSDLAREVRTAETTTDAVTRACETLTTDLSFPFVTVHLFDSESGRLLPVRDDADCDLFAADSPLFSVVEEGPGWEAFIDGMEVVFDDLPAEADAVDESGSDDPTPPRGCIFEPLGRYGVLAVGSPHPAAFSTADIETVGMAALTLRSALERIQKEMLLEDRKTDLREQTVELERLERLNDTIRSIVRTLPQSSTREEIEQSVCNHFGAADPYKLAWIGHPDAATDQIKPTAAAGEAVEYPSEITVSTTGPVEKREPAARALATNETQVVDLLQTGPPFEPWQKVALKRGLRSVVAVPLTYGDRNYGVLSLYIGDDASVQETEVAVKTELGGIIAHAITSLDRKLALVGDRSIELEFDINDSSLDIVQLVNATNADAFEFETVVRNADDTLRVFFAIKGRDIDLENAVEFAESKVIVEDYTLLSQTDDALHFECTLAGRDLLSDMLEHGAVPQRMSGTERGVRLTVEVPQNTDIRRFVSMMQTKYKDTELVARRQRDRPIQTQQEFGTYLDELLTERQLEVLQTAYFSGFFEWPRDATGEEVAEVLGISQPTFARHVRRAERVLFESLFDESDAPDELR